MILRRTNPAFHHLPRYDPPKGLYNAETMARFVRNYRTMARGFYDAIRTEHLHRETWLCPNCDKTNTVKRISETGVNYCKWCEQRSTYHNILLGQS